MAYLSYPNRSFLLAVLLTLELLIVVLLGVFSVFPHQTLAIVGVNNVTVGTQLQVGNVFPEILNVTLLNGNSVTLTPSTTTNVTFVVVARDYNGQADIINITATFFDTIASTLPSANNNNDHYTTNCTIDTSYGDIYEVNATCLFPVWYYANNATWQITTVANDTYGLYAVNNSTTNINTLLAVGLPDVIDYGQVNATQVSNENITNVTNYGNVRINLTLQGYAVTFADNLSMNCTLGAIKNISIDYEKYNLTGSNPGNLNLAQFSARYLNLTGDSTVKTFNLNYRQNDNSNEALQSTYWRIYVPIGVAGTCRGNIVFGATQSAGT